MKSNPPNTLHTNRLLLRPFIPADIDPYAAIRSKPHLHRFMPGGEAGTQNADEKARMLVAEWSSTAWQASEHAYAPWAVIEKATGQLTGHLGLRFLEDLGETELLYLLDDRVHGQGFATEGGRAALGFARDEPDLTQVVAMALPENTSSLRVMERIGMLRLGPFHAFGLDTVKYQIRFDD